MNIARTIHDARVAISAARAQGATVGFVPTMGFLHEGHLSLIDAARANGATYIVVSIFVNPTQFGPQEDFASYPRNEMRDIALLEQRAVDLLFAPSSNEIYPRGARTTVRVAGVAAPLEGERRPGHFDGVATVVAKLFNIVEPDIAVFGQKDAQQCGVIRRMTRDLDFNVRLVIAPTVRETDGVAMSSRNSYLSPEERSLAPALHCALQAGARAVRSGASSVHEVEAAMLAALGTAATVDYLVLVDAESFLSPDDFHRDLLVAGAVRVGRTRLIDNIPLPLAERAVPQITSERLESLSSTGSIR